MRLAGSWSIRRRATRRIAWWVRRASAGKRVLPHFLIIGAQKAGTTSLYGHLSHHPNIVPAFQKEVHFWDVHYSRGIDWYRTFFPTATEMREGVPPVKRLTGEASPYYLFHPWAPRRVATELPNSRLIVLLRNPIDRAYSHYQHEVRRGREALTFEAAVAAEVVRLEGETKRLESDAEYVSEPHRRHSYLSRGVYCDQLERWLQCVRREQLLVLLSEEFFRVPETTFVRVLAHLGLEPSGDDQFLPLNTAGYQQMKPAIRRALADFFQPHNRRLEEMLGRQISWE